MKYIKTQLTFTIDEEVLNELQSALNHLTEMEQECDKVDVEADDLISEIYQELVSTRGSLDEFLILYNSYQRLAKE